MTSDPKGNLTENLKELEERGWQALSDGTAGEFYERILAREAVMLFPGFGILDRATTLETMRAAPPWAWFRLEDVRVLTLSADSAVVYYRARAQRDGEPEYRALMNSTYVREDGEWRLALHQHSPEPNPSGPARSGGA